MARYRKKPVVIEAVQYLPGKDDGQELLALLDGREGWHMADNYRDGHPAIVIPTLEGDMVATAEDWIIRGVKGELYPCKAAIFDATYEPA